MFLRNRAIKNITVFLRAADIRFRISLTKSGDAVLFLMIRGHNLMFIVYPSSLHRFMPRFSVALSPSAKIQKIHNVLVVA